MTARKRPAKKSRRALAGGPAARRHAEVPFVGRLRERQKVASAIHRGLFPATLLLIGGDGIGKQRFGEWIAQSLLCERPRSGAPCGVCNSCRHVRDISHPDLHTYLPHGSVGGGNVEQQIAGVEEQRAGALEARRSDALHMGTPPEHSFYLATIRALRREATRRPTMGARKVFLLPDIDRLSGGGGSMSEAANALLKLLEEPPAGTHFVLTSSAPHRIPATIRSRATELVLCPLPESEVRVILTEALPEATEMEDEISRAAAHSGGSVRRARQWLTPEWQTVRGAAVELVRVALTGDAAERYRVVRSQGNWAVKTEGAKAGKGTLEDLFAHLEDVLIESGRFASRSEDFSPAVSPALKDLLESVPSASIPGPGQWANGALLAAEALAHARRSASAKLTMHVLLESLERVLSASDS